MRTDDGRVEKDGGETNLAAYVAGGLGALAAMLAVILVGVIIGWAITCHRSKPHLTRER